MIATMLDPANPTSSAPQRDSGQARGRSARLARAASGGLWPLFVRRRSRHVFVARRRLTGLRSLGAPIDGCQIEIRSRKGAGVWAMARGFGNPIGRGQTVAEATMSLLRLIAPAAFAN